MQKGPARPLSGFRGGGRFHAFHGGANARAKRDTSDGVVTLLFPRCQSARKARVAVTGAHLTSPRIPGAVVQRSRQGVRRIDRAFHRGFREGINRDRSIYSAESAVFEQIARAGYNGAVTAVVRSGKTDRVFPLLGRRPLLNYGRDSDRE